MSTKVFISYSWSSPTHEDWVLSLAHRLISDGIDVALDKWDLKEGQDKYSFMESMVQSPEITKVLIILDKKYAAKADLRSGGVGTETQIISPNVYEEAAQEKFIPIVIELDEDGKPYLPTYLKSRIYIDLAMAEHFETGYEKLIRNILNRPSISKPQLGTPPSYLFEESAVSYKTTTLLRGFDNQIDRQPARINVLSADFFSEFFENLKSFKIDYTKSDGSMGKRIYENILQYTPLRDDYIAFLEKLAKSHLEFDSDVLIRFFESLITLHSPEEVGASYQDYHFSNFKFITYELFLYAVAVFLKHERYLYLTDLLYTRYFAKTRPGYASESDGYSQFNFTINEIKDYYNQTKGVNMINATADLLITRLPSQIKLPDFVDSDLLCYYIGSINGVRWFPQTYLYKGRYNIAFPFFNRLVSLKHFEKVKELLNVSTISELKVKLADVTVQQVANPYRYTNTWEGVTAFNDLIDLDKIGTSR
jgi:hypothetical protein